jgi:hypothetical protein
VDLRDRRVFLHAFVPFITAGLSVAPWCHATKQFTVASVEKDLEVLICSSSATEPDSSHADTVRQLHALRVRVD